MYMIKLQKGVEICNNVKSSNSPP